MKPLLLLCSLLFTTSAFGQAALYKIQFYDLNFVSFPDHNIYRIYPLSERAAPVIRGSTGRKLVAADYLVGIKLKTGNPEAAARAMLDQIADAAKSKLGAIWNSEFKESLPGTVLTGIGKNSVWSILSLPPTAAITSPRFHISSRKKPAVRSWF